MESPKSTVNKSVIRDLDENLLKERQDEFLRARESVRRRSRSQKGKSHGQEVKDFHR